MQTVNFQCGHCRKLMAVSTDFLGQQVRCPHCQQVVVAPAPASAPPAPVPPQSAFLEPTIQFGEHQRGEQDSIFAPPEPTDDLFDSPASAPRLQMPVVMPPAPAPEPFFPVPAPPAPLEPTMAAAAPSLDSTLAYVPAEQSAPGLEATAVLTGGLAGLPLAVDGESTFVASDAFPGPESKPISRPIRQPAAGGQARLIILFSLVSYSILATILLIVIGYNYYILATRPNNVLDQLPDVLGDSPGVKKVKEQASWSYPKSLATDPLPRNLRVELGKTLRLGDLEVTPKKVEQKTVKVHVEGPFVTKPEPCLNPSLVLHLHLKNMSSDYAFVPLDNYFDRNWKDQVGPPPLTVLEVGRQRFHGGPAKWYPIKRDPNKRLSREWVDGRQNYDARGLAPGDSMDTITCTDGNISKVVLAVAEHQGPFLWRVHLRRGLSSYKGKHIPATAVIGVEFTDKDIVKVAE